MTHVGQLFLCVLQLLVGLLELCLAGVVVVLQGGDSLLEIPHVLLLLKDSRNFYYFLVFSSFYVILNGLT